MNVDDHRSTIMEIFDEVLRAVDPERLVRTVIALDGKALSVGGERHELLSGGKLVVLGVGKSAVGMARGIEAVLGERLDRGLIVTKRGLGKSASALTRTTVLEADHPVPDESSVEAGEQLLQQAAQLGERDLAIVVISGGGSALAEAPSEGITLDDLSAATSALLSGGAGITTLNAVRRRLSRIKAGGLARAIAPARVINLVLSDVLGNPLNVIASGPTVSTDSDDDRRIQELRAGDVWRRLPGAVRLRLDSVSSRQPPEVANVVQTAVIGDAMTAARAAKTAAAKIGYAPVLLGAGFEGEAREFGHFWAQLACSVDDGVFTLPRPACLVGAGEMTVTVRGDGAGGRNTEMAASAAIELDGRHGITIASLATDGDDGTSEAAGGVVDGESISRLLVHGLDPIGLLGQNDTRQFLEACDGLIVTGQTGTNVNDLYLALIE